MDTTNIDFIYFTGDNCVDFPKGGITSFTRQMMRAFGNRMALVGISTDDTPVGMWVNKEFDGTTYLFFSIAKANKNEIKPLLPTRLTNYYKLKKYKNEILSLNVENAFVQNSHFLLAIKNWPIKNKAYIFHGVTNPLKKARYWFAKLIANSYERIMFKRLKDYNSIFAAADDNDIRKMISRSGNKLKKEDINKLPTRFDDAVFYPNGKESSAKILGLKKNSYIFVQVGRLSKQKGCDFIIKSFHEFIKKYPDSILYFVGDGEERANVEKKITSLNLSEKVVITGFTDPKSVANYYNAADLVLVGSYMEGWSVAMVEALACGKKIVSTNISGTKDMILPGKNGFIVDNRDPKLFAQKMEEALKLSSGKEHSVELSKSYSLSTLKDDIEMHWKFHKQ